MNRHGVIGKLLPDKHDAWLTGRTDPEMFKLYRQFVCAHGVPTAHIRTLSNSVTMAEHARRSKDRVGDRGR